MTVEEAVMEYGDMLFRISMVLLGHEQDAQDVVQDTFCRYMEHRQALYDKDHEKAPSFGFSTIIFWNLF